MELLQNRQLNSMVFDLSEIHTIKDLEQEFKELHPTWDWQKISAAFHYAEDIHTGETRKNGDPRIWHLLTTSAYLARIGLDDTSVICGLLHEILDIAPQNLPELEKKFGAEVGFIVDGLTALKQQAIKFDTHNENPDSFRRLIMNSADDIRVLIVRLANKLHNIQSLSCLPIERQISQANKTLLVYAPMCEFLGLGAFQTPLENFAFTALHPTEAKLIMEYISSQSASFVTSVTQLQAELESDFAKYGITNLDISYRTKSVYSSFRKAKRKYVPPGEELGLAHLQQVKDLHGMRIICDRVEQCYLILGLIHAKWPYLESEFDDYIVHPKVSGYRSIHTVIDYAGRTMEIQIRTREMHEYNEFGPASHISYKLGNPTKEISTLTKDLNAWRGEGDENKFRVKSFAESIFVFTPKGKIIKLDKGASPLDFAYQIHTQLLSKLRGAKVNGKLVAMGYQLQTGDVVEIVEGKVYNINRDWLKYAQMAPTRSFIRKEIRRFVDKH